MLAIDLAPARQRIRATLRPVTLDDGTRASRADVDGGYAIIHEPDPPLSPGGYEGGRLVELFLGDGVKFGRMRCRDIDHAIDKLAELEDK